MNTLITPAQVVSLAFCDGEFISADTISQSDILAAQRRYIKPILGDKLYQKVQSQRADSTLIESYIAPALAIGTRIIVQPTLAIRTGQFGLTVTKTAHSQPATNAEISQLIKAQRIKLRACLSCIVEFLDCNRDLYPEYNPTKKRHNRHEIVGGVIM